MPSLNQRYLRVSLDGPWTEYRWTEKHCRTRILGICFKNEYIDHIEKDFDFTKKEDRANFLAMGFDCSVRKMPEGQQSAKVIIETDEPMQIEHLDQWVGIIK